MEFIKDLSESRLFKTGFPDDLSLSNLTESFFASMLALQLLSIIDKENISHYIEKTLEYNLSSWKSSGSDIHNLAHILSSPQRYKNKIKLNKFVIFPKEQYKNFLESLLNDQKNLIFFFKIQKNLDIRNPKLKALRRNIEGWNKLTENEKKNTAVKLYLFLKPYMSQSDLWKYLYRTLKKHKLIHRDIHDVKDKTASWHKIMNG